MYTTKSGEYRCCAHLIALLRRHNAVVIVPITRPTLEFYKHLHTLRAHLGVLYASPDLRGSSSTEFNVGGNAPSAYYVPFDELTPEIQTTCNIYRNRSHRSFCVEKNIRPCNPDFTPKPTLIEAHCYHNSGGGDMDMEWIVYTNDHLGIEATRNGIYVTFPARYTFEDGTVKFL